jgi:nicotinamidase-related amidase
MDPQHTALVLIGYQNDYFRSFRRTESQLII